MGSGWSPRTITWTRAWAGVIDSERDLGVWLGSGATEVSEDQELESAPLLPVMSAEGARRMNCSGQAPPGTRTLWSGAAAGDVHLQFSSPPDVSPNFSLLPNKRHHSGYVTDEVSVNVHATEAQRDAASHPLGQLSSKRWKVTRVGRWWRNRDPLTWLVRI